MTFLGVQGITKRFGAVVAAERLSFDVPQGECLALLGPSGCGKTTLLNIVAGFIRPDAGEVTVGGRQVTAMPPHRRDMGMVFQDYALFPHLSVIENVEFGLRMRGVAAETRRSKAARALDLVGMAELGGRGVHQLSGGQRQRVAVARALAIEPQLLLFDEPLSNLDARLRDTMRTEIRSLLTRTGITALFVTHDQAEAFGVADRVALLNGGRLEQIGKPDEIYERPATRFVAGFLGNCNLIDGRVLGSDGGRLVVEALGTTLRALRPEIATGASVTLAVRPHQIAVGPAAGDAVNQVAGTVTTVEYLGWLTRAGVRHASGQTLLLEAPGRAVLAVGDGVALSWSPDHAWPIAA